MPARQEDGSAEGRDRAAREEHRADERRAFLKQAGMVAGLAATGGWAALAPASRLAYLTTSDDPPSITSVTCEFAAKAPSRPGSSAKLSKVSSCIGVTLSSSGPIAPARSGRFDHVMVFSDQPASPIR